jgi:transposase
MMGRQDRDQGQLVYEFSLDEMIPSDHLLRRINVFAKAALADLHQQLKAFYSDIGRPSVDPEPMIRMLLVSYCYGIRHERRLCQEVALHLAYRWFCKLDLDDKIPHHSTFSVNRLGRFRESEILRHIFERVVAACMAAGLVKGEGFAADASVMEANASRYHGKAPDELDWTGAQALGIDEMALWRAEPALLRDMERLCSFCTHKRRCHQELAAGPAATNYVEYCENADTIDMLRFKS